MAPLKTWAIYFLYLTTCLATPVQALSFNPEKPQSLHTSSHPKIDSSIYGVPTEINLLQRNEDYTIWRARPGVMIQPVQVAATVLDSFYTSVFNEASQRWSLLPPVGSFNVREGCLKLAFDSIGGPIPWDLVIHFAWKLRSATRLGWVGTYEIIYIDRASTHTIGITLTVLSNRIQAQKRSLPTSLDSPRQQLVDHFLCKGALVKRDEIRLSFYKIYGTVFPVFLASERLRDFFIAIAREASSTWTSRPESALFTVTQGPFQLTVSSLRSTLPWKLLAIAAEKFSAYADHLFINTFDAFYVETAGRLTIGFSLRVLKGHEGSIAEAAIRLSAPSLRGLDQKGPATSAAASGTSLNRRSDTDPGLKMTKFRPMNIIGLVPSALAAARLEDFYTIIALKVETGFFSNRQPARSVILELFEFELTITCNSIDVPWSFVQAFAIKMAAWSSQRFSGLYEATIRGDGPLTNLVFIVSMKLKNPPRPPSPNGR